MPKTKKKLKKKRKQRFLREDNSYDNIFIQQIQKDLLSCHYPYAAVECSCLECVVRDTQGGKKFPRNRKLLQKAVKGLASSYKICLLSESRKCYLEIDGNSFLLSYFKPYIIPDALLRMHDPTRYWHNLFLLALNEYERYHTDLCRGLPSEKELLVRTKVRALCYLWYQRGTSLVLGVDLCRYICSFIL
jgi:hypothetical protein